MYCPSMVMPLLFHQRECSVDAFVSFQCLGYSFLQLKSLGIVKGSTPVSELCSPNTETVRARLGRPAPRRLLRDLPLERDVNSLECLMNECSLHALDH